MNDNIKEDDWKDKTCDGCEYLCMVSDQYSSEYKKGDFECRRYPPVNEMDCVTFMYPVVIRNGVLMNACAEFKPNINESL